MPEATRRVVEEYSPEQAKATLDQLHAGMQQRHSVGSGWNRILLRGDILPGLNDHPRQLPGKQAKTFLQSCPLLGAAGEERYRIAPADQIVR